MKKRFRPRSSEPLIGAQRPQTLGGSARDQLVAGEAEAGEFPKVGRGRSPTPDEAPQSHCGLWPSEQPWSSQMAGPLELFRARAARASTQLIAKPIPFNAAGACEPGDGRKSRAAPAK